LVIYIGVDAAWGEIKDTGIVALSSTGTVIDAALVQGIAQTVAWVQTHSGNDTLVFVDAPLVVVNAEGQRLCEKHVGQRYWRWNVSANSTNTASKALGGVALLAALQGVGFRYNDGLDGPPARGRVVSECYPYTTIVGYAPFDYDERPTYKRKPKAVPAAAFPRVRAAACDGLVQRVSKLADADPPLDLASHDLTRTLIEESSPIDNKRYKRREDLLDAALCAWTAALWDRHGLAACQVLGESAGVRRPAATIIAPARPEQRVPYIPSSAVPTGG
jgi:predicted RNase H-like nuclease